MKKFESKVVDGLFLPAVGVIMFLVCANSLEVDGPMSLEYGTYWWLDKIGHTILDVTWAELQIQLTKIFFIDALFLTPLAAFVLVYISPIVFRLVGDIMAKALFMTLLSTYLAILLYPWSCYIYHVDVVGDFIAFTPIIVFTIVLFGSIFIKLFKLLRYVLTYGFFYLMGALC
jgi:hypothetical protein